MDISVTAEEIGNMVKRIEEITDKRILCVEMKDLSYFRLQFAGGSKSKSDSPYLPLPPLPSVQELLEKTKTN